jgi:hypothetical protein
LSIVNSVLINIGYNGILAFKKEGNITICINMDESGGYYVK